MYVLWDSGWIKYLRELKLQNLVINKPIANTKLKTASSPDKMRLF